MPPQTKVAGQVVENQGSSAGLRAGIALLVVVAGYGVLAVLPIAMTWKIFGVLMLAPGFVIAFGKVSSNLISYLATAAFISPLPQYVDRRRTPHPLAKRARVFGLNLVILSAYYAFAGALFLILFVTSFQSIGPLASANVDEASAATIALLLAFAPRAALFAKGESAARGLLIAILTPLFLVAAPVIVFSVAPEPTIDILIAVAFVIALSGPFAMLGDIFIDRFRRWQIISHLEDYEAATEKALVRQIRIEKDLFNFKALFQGLAVEKRALRQEMASKIIRVLQQAARVSIQPGHESTRRALLDALKKSVDENLEVYPIPTEIPQILLLEGDEIAVREAAKCAAELGDTAISMLKGEMKTAKRSVVRKAILKELCDVRVLNLVPTVIEALADPVVHEEARNCLNLLQYQFADLVGELPTQEMQKIAAQTAQLFDSEAHGVREWAARFLGDVGRYVDSESWLSLQKKLLELSDDVKDEVRSEAAASFSELLLLSVLVPIKEGWKLIGGDLLATLRRRETEAQHLWGFLELWSGSLPENQKTHLLGEMSSLLDVSGKRDRAARFLEHTIPSLYPEAITILDSAFSAFDQTNDSETNDVVRHLKERLAQRSAELERTKLDS